MSLGWLLLLACVEEPMEDTVIRETGAPGQGFRGYLEACAGCHGYAGRGGPRGPDLQLVAVGRTVAEVADVALEGFRGMPPVALPRAEAERIADFVVNELLVAPN